LSATSDIPSLIFVDPNTVDERWRVVLYGAPGVGKTVAATSAPGPIVALSADRPGAYRYARRHHAGTEIREARFSGSKSLRDVYDYVRGAQDEIGTVVLDPWNTMYDELVRENTTGGGKPNWQKVNDLALGVVRSFRDLDVNLVLVAHERREEDENGDTEAKVFPQLGGPALVQRLMAEVDIVARVFRREDEEAGPSWHGQLVTARGYQCKDSTGVLGRVREVDLSEWFAAANADQKGDDSDLPFSPRFVEPEPSE
jgi:hypothetical protein